MFSITSTGSFSKTQAFLKALQKDSDIMTILNNGGLRGVLALRLATPVKTGLVAASWDYNVKKAKGVYILTFTNSDIEGGFPVAVMIQYGYGTGNGGYVEGIDYINPALKPIFDDISNEIWKVVRSA